MFSKPEVSIEKSRFLWYNVGHIKVAQEVVSVPTKIVIGKRYGMLTVDAATEKKDYRGRTLYHCTCECTGTRLVAADRLLAGGVRSCGCAQERAQKQIGGSKERRGWTAEEDAARIAKRMKGCEGIYQRGDTYIAQMKIDYKTYHIGSYRKKTEALKARQAVVQARIKNGNAAAIECITELKKARRK